MPTTDASTIGIMSSTLNEYRRSSRPNIAPPRGALKTAAMPAAKPETVSRRILRSDRWNTCPRAEPMDEPICAIGPSLPALPPLPIMIDEEMAFMNATRFLILLFWVSIAIIISGMPWPFDSLHHLDTIMPDISAPITGIAMRDKLFDERFGLIMLKNMWWLNSIMDLNAIALMPPMMPAMIARVFIKSHFSTRDSFSIVSGFMGLSSFLLLMVWYYCVWFLWCGEQICCADTFVA